MLTVRVIPCLLLKDKGLVKTVKFKNPRYIGDPINAIKIFNDKEVDELIFLDIEATKKGITVSEDEIIAQIQQVRDSITGQGGTLEEELSRQGMTEADLREQVILQKKVEKILAESVLVSDEDVDAFLTQNQIVVPEQGGQELRERARVQLKNQKLSQEIDGWLSSLKNSASITYYTEY